MNINMLKRLDNRWPGDTVSNDETSLSEQLTELINSSATESIYSAQLRLAEQDSQTIAAFAASNGMTYAARSDLVTEGLTDYARAWPGRTLNTTAPMLAHIIKGCLFGYDVRMFLAYVPAASQLKGAHDVRLTKWSIIRISLPKLFPQMVLESNKNDKSSISTTSSSFVKSQKLDLEGNFSNYFDFYSPVGLQVNTLSVLAPNFMHLLIEAALIFDIEFYGNEMILITKDPLYSPRIMTVALNTLKAELEYLARLESSWNYVPIKLPFDTLEKTYLEGNGVKVGSIRISPAQLIGLILMGFVIFAIILLSI